MGCCARRRQVVEDLLVVGLRWVYAAVLWLKDKWW